MSGLSGYDGDVVGFDSISLTRRPEADSSNQTSEFSESSVASQTNLMKECGSAATPEALNAQDDVLKEYPPPGLNEFLRKVVPSVLEQLDENDKEMLYNSSESDDEEVLSAKLVQEIKLAELPGSGCAGDPRCVLDLSWSSAGNSLAVSVGRNQHENWCTDNGIIRVFHAERSAVGKFVKTLAVTEKSCISVIKYHPSVSALLAYGTSCGDVVLCNLNELDAVLLTSPPGTHGSKRVSALHWVNMSLAENFLRMHILNTGKRRGASDHVLMSAGSDGTISAWQVNAHLKIFENIITYSVNGSKKMVALDVTCFDFIKSHPLRPSDQKVTYDTFVVGTTTGEVFLCKAKTYQPIVDSKMVDPVSEVFDGHKACVLDVAFSFQKPGIFVSASIDSELRVYDIGQTAPLKVFCLDVPISCLAWLPNNPCVVVLGLARSEGQLLKVYNVSSGRSIPVEGFNGAGDCITAVTINQSGVCRIAAGDTDSNVRIWDLPSRRIRVTADDMDF